MNGDLETKPFDLEKLPAEVVTSLPPASSDAEVAVSQLTPPPEFPQASRLEAFSLTFLYTVAFAVATLIFCLHGSLVIGFPYDERLVAFSRATYASILGSLVLGPVYFTNERFITYLKAKNEVVNTHLANGRLLKTFGHSVLLCAVAIAAVMSASALGLGLIFWPLVYSDTVPTEKMTVDAILVPVACLLGGLRWAYEMVSMVMWTLIRIPKISTGLEGNKYDRLVKIACVLLFLFVFIFISDPGCSLEPFSPFSGC